MSNYQIIDRWITRDSKARLASLLGVADYPDMQDWDVECADASRVGEFLDLYELKSLNDDDQFALMALIVASVDDLLMDGEVDEAILQRFSCLLSHNFKLHGATVRYWSLLNESHTENMFAVTPLMREIWKQLATGSS